MILPHGQHPHQHYQRQLSEVQSYIQARVQTDEPYLLNVNAAQVAEYQDELQHYVKQKQRHVRRPLPMSRDAPAACLEPRSSASEGCARSRSTHTPAQRTSSQRQSHWSSECTPSIVPNRLPGVEWLLAHNHYQQHHQLSQSTRYESLPPCTLLPDVPVMLPPSPLPYVPDVGTYAAMHHRTLKKQKTM